jgi:hypothetical protein
VRKNDRKCGEKGKDGDREESLNSKGGGGVVICRSFLRGGIEREGSF